MPDLANDNPSVTQGDNPSPEPSASPLGTSASGGQAPAGAAAPSVDLFKGIDPNKLPPEVKAHYDSMLRDYRDKTAKLADTIKSEVAKGTESYKQKAALYDEISSQETFVKQWNDYVEMINAGYNGAGYNGAGYNGDGQQNGNHGPGLELDLAKKVEELSRKMERSELTTITDAFAHAEDEKGNPLHPDFDKLNEIVLGKMTANGKDDEYTLLRITTELAQGTPTERLANGYKAAKAIYDSIFEEGRKAGMGRLQSKVLNSTNPPTGTAAGQMTTEKKPKNAYEALELAKKGVRVSS